MDFDLIEQLSESEVEELYEDKLACACTARGYVFVDSKNQIHWGQVHWLWNYASCDAPQNRSPEACREWCISTHGELPPDDLIGKDTMVYEGFARTFVRGHLHSPVEVVAYISNCIVPSDAECSGDGWSRSLTNGNWSTKTNLFHTHCQQEEE